MEWMITDYVLVRGEAQFVEDHVNKLIRDGWQPHGSPSMTQHLQCKPDICQAMVKYKQEGTEKG